MAKSATQTYTQLLLQISLIYTLLYIVILFIAFLCFALRSLFLQLTMPAV